jgi:hypothetical protein
VTECTFCHLKIIELSKLNIFVIQKKIIKHKFLYKYSIYVQNSFHTNSLLNDTLQYHWWPKIFKVNSGFDISSKLVESVKTAHEAEHKQLMYTAFNKLSSYCTITRKKI